jgi:hypothetical protein
VRRFVWAFAVIWPLLVAARTIPPQEIAFLALASASLAALLAAGTSRPVQMRLGFVRAPSVKYRRVYDEVVALREALRGYLFYNGPETPRAQWEPRVVQCDRHFWGLVDDVFYARGAALRGATMHINQLTAGTYTGERNWAANAEHFLAGRQEMLDKLLKELPDD